MKLAIFDFDGTLFTRDTLPSLGEQWMQQGRSRLRFLAVYVSIFPVLIAYKSGWIEREKMKYMALRNFQKIFRGMPRNEIQKFFQEAYPGIKKYFNPIVLEEIKLARKEGFHLVLLSGAYADLLQLVAEDLEIDTVIGAELHFRDEYIDYRREISFVDGVSKRHLLEKTFAGDMIDWGATRSFGDSYSDRPILEIAGEAVVVNPETMLLEHARAHNWRVIEGGRYTGI